MANLMAIFLFVAGVVFAVWPRAVAEFGEYLNALGSERSGHFAEPTDLNVTVTRLVGIGSALVGLAGLLGVL